MNKFRYLIISKKVCICALALVFVLVLGIFAAVGWDETLTVGAQGKKLPIYCTEKQEKIVSLSFDAAWGNTFWVQNSLKSQKTREVIQLPCLFVYNKYIILVLSSETYELLYS